MLQQRGQLQPRQAVGVGGLRFGGDAGIDHLFELGRDVLEPLSLHRGGHFRVALQIETGDALLVAQERERDVIGRDAGVGFEK